MFVKTNKLETLPEDPGVTKVFECWLKTFETFLSAVTSVTDNKKVLNGFELLTNYLSPQTDASISTYRIRRSCTISLLVVSKEKESYFTRPVLMTRLQAQNESISQYVHTLHNHAKEYSFQAVSAEKYKDSVENYQRTCLLYFLCFSDHNLRVHSLPAPFLFYALI